MTAHPGRSHSAGRPPVAQGRTVGGRPSATGRLSPVAIPVTQGVATLSGTLPDRMLVPVTARTVRAVEGVVDIRLGLTHR